MILSHGANCISNNSNSTIMIGGRKYKTTKIGTLIWLAENLEYKFDGLKMGNVNTTTEPYASYGGQSGLGLFYNGTAAVLLNDNRATLLPEGWRVPTPSDYSKLISNGGSNGIKLKTTYGWNDDTNGTDDYGFSAFPAGRLVVFSSASIYDYGRMVMYWSTERHAGTYTNYQSDLHIELSNILVGSQEYNIFMKMRLVKDA